ncbi:hypothetical protein OAD60_02180 [Candidatus Thioglobus sp.]|nr:hypothetical protein [Candidatus Thioglobus sp.]
MNGEKKYFFLQIKQLECFISPNASRLGSTSDEESLLGSLQKQKIHINEHYLFSVFENNDDKTSLIYYRTKVEDGSSITTGQFYEFDSIPFELLADDASRIMLKRYIAERDLNAFGVFVGKESEGNVEAISKTNQNV